MQIQPSDHYKHFGSICLKSAFPMNKSSALAAKRSENAFNNFFLVSYNVASTTAKKGQGKQIFFKIK